MAKKGRTREVVTMVARGGSDDARAKTWREATERDPWLWNGAAAYVALVLEARHLAPMLVGALLARMRLRRGRRSKEVT